MDDIARVTVRMTPAEIGLAIAAIGDALTWLGQLQQRPPEACSNHSDFAIRRLNEAAAILRTARARELRIKP